MKGESKGESSVGQKNRCQKQQLGNSLSANSTVMSGHMNTQNKCPLDVTSFN